MRIISVSVGGGGSPAEAAAIEVAAASLLSCCLCCEWEGSDKLERLLWAGNWEHTQ